MNYIAGIAPAYTQNIIRIAAMVSHRINVDDQSNLVKLLEQIFVERCEGEVYQFRPECGRYDDV